MNALLEALHDELDRDEELQRKEADLPKAKFGRLLVLTQWSHQYPSGGKKVMCRCVCDCGTQVSVLLYRLKSGYTRSCGCYQREVAAAALFLHGHGKVGETTPAYRSWLGMLRRCTNPNATGYKNYGGRGISVCERWRDYRNFLADMGERPCGTSIDRYPNNDGDYEPNNCRWATRSEQRRNRRDYQKYLSPEAIAHFKEKYPPGCWDDDLPRGDEPEYGEPE